MRIRKSRLKIEGQNDRADMLTRESQATGPEEALAVDNRRELGELIHSAETVDPFEQYFSTRSLADRILTAYADLGDGRKLWIGSSGHASENQDACAEWSPTFRWTGAAWLRIHGT